MQTMQYPAVLRIIRPFNCFIAGGTVWVGARQFAPQPPTSADLLAAAVAAFAACAFGNVRNDMIDLYADRISHPGRALPQADLSTVAAGRVAAVLLVVSLASSASAGVPITAVTTGAVVFLELYNRWLKQIAGVGHLVVALLGTLPLFTGALTVPGADLRTIPGWVVPALFAFLLHLAREIAKAARDIPGDRAAGFRSLPDYVGPQMTLSIILILLIAFGSLVILGIWPEWYSRWFFVIAAAAWISSCVPVFVALARNPAAPDWSTISLGLKAAMLLGLVALAIK